jgi:adenosylhomocysteinase
MNLRFNFIPSPVVTTGNLNVCDSAMLKMLKQGAVVCNIGHFDNEIDTHQVF